MKKSTKIIILGLIGLTIVFTCEVIKSINDMRELTKLVHGN